MPRQDLSDITLVLDRSGSMTSIASDTVGGVARFIEDQRKAPGSANLTLVLFDHEYLPIHKAVPLGAVPPFTAELFVPRGATAMLDAIGRSIAETGERLSSIPEADRPSAVIFVIVTDGLENSSKEFTRPKVAEMIKHQQESYSWTFIFLAANQDAIAAASGIGIAPSNAMSYAANTGGVEHLYAVSSSNVRSARSGGPVAFSAADREAQRKHGAH